MVSKTNWTDVISIISHQVNNTLANIKAYNELINTTTDQKKIKTYTKIVNKNVNYLTYTSNQINETHNSSLASATKFDLIELTSKLKNEYEIVDISSENKKVFVAADYNQIKQVFNYIIAVKLKLSQRVSKITFKVEVNNKVIISIKDDGEKLDDFQLKNIFEPYYVHTKERINKVGVGYFSIRNIIEKNNGNIQIDNSAIKIELPL